MRFKSEFMMGAVAGAAVALAGGFAYWSMRPGLNDKEVRGSYALGLQIGQNLKRQGLDHQRNAFLAGVRDALNDSSALGADEIKTALNDLHEIMKTKFKPSQPPPAPDALPASPPGLTDPGDSRGPEKMPSRRERRARDP